MGELEFKFIMPEETEESRRIEAQLQEHREEVGQEILKSMKFVNTWGVCPEFSYASTLAALEAFTASLQGEFPAAPEPTVTCP